MLASLSTEVCVIGLFVAAAVVAYVAKPARSGPARQHLLGGALSAEGPEEPSVDVTCDADGSVTVWRNGLTGLTSVDAVSLALNIRGFDVEIIERTHVSRVSSTGAEPIDSARYRIDFLARERYHITYKINDDVAAAFNLHVRPGIALHVPLSV